MKIIKFRQFNENMVDPPEEYIKTALLKIKRKVEKMFEEPESSDPDKVMTLKQATDKGDKEKSVSLYDLGLKLEDSETSNYSALHDNLTIRFSEPENWYSLYIVIPLDYALTKDDKDFSDKDIEYCSIKFKKYRGDDDTIVGQIGPRRIKISDINADLLVNLKIELDDDFEDEEKLDIEI